jgi:hypothetical protein
MSKISRSLIIYRHKNMNVPDAYLEKAVKAYPHWCGLAFLSDGEITYSQSIEPATVAGIKKIQNDEEYINSDIIFTLGREAGKPELTDASTCLQPFETITEIKGNAQITHAIAFVDGDFSEYANNEASDGRPYLFVKTYLTPKIRDIWELVGEDPQKLANQLKKPHVDKEIIAAAMSGEDKEVCIAILTSAPEKGFISFMSSDKSDDYPWGFVNDSLGYTGTDDNDEEGDKTGSTAKTGDTSRPTMFQGRPPATLIKNEHLRAAYSKFHGKPTPNGYKERSWQSILPDMVEAARTEGWDLKPLASTEPTKPDKPATVSVPTVTNKEKALQFVKAIDVSTLVVMTPEEMAKNEIARPTFFDQTGAKLQDVINWDKKTVDKLIEDNPELASVLFRDYAFAIHRLNSELEEATKPEPVVQTANKPKTRITMSS